MCFASFIVDWTFSHLERLIGSISVLENGPRESHTRIPILTLYLVSLLVLVQQVYKYPATDCGQPLTNDLFLYPKIPHFSSLFYFLFTLILCLSLFLSFYLEVFNPFCLLHFLGQVYCPHFCYPILALTYFCFTQFSSSSFTKPYLYLTQLHPFHKILCLFR